MTNDIRRATAEPTGLVRDRQMLRRRTEKRLDTVLETCVVVEASASEIRTEDAG